MGTVHCLSPDTFAPMRFDMTADKIRSARADAAMAQHLKLWAQTAEQLALRGELDRPTRLKLMLAIGAALDHPQVTG
jgi:hypothetical protein